MNAATSFPEPEFSSGEETATTFRAVFDHSPLAVARCNPEGVIVDMNPAFERSLDRGVAHRRCLRLGELVRPQDRAKTDLLLHDLLESKCDSIAIGIRGAGHGQTITQWTAWRQPGCGGEPDHALLFAEKAVAEQERDVVPSEENLLQTQRWEAVGRLAGGVVHDFNNLLTGVMLYCDLLLSSLDARDRRRRYADEIRSAIVQATALVGQLLVFARPQAAPTRLLCLNEIALAMRELLSRLIGENIELDFHLDPSLGAVKIDQAQAQQILLNLVLNARDALPDGGRITVETSNCRFQPVEGTVQPRTFPTLPCVLLAVGDNGHGMSAETRQRLFEPFFTTKNAGKGTGLGLTTVRSIVTTNHGLIHFESESGRGTRVMILLPRSLQTAQAELRDAPHPVSETSSSTSFQLTEKESLL
ncbi:MAG: ATP-binding protein [Candidatus Sulfotelmatobacter sp.]|jgi:two-component system, cell cycle sensor histidine kinase and response regulator CckA